MQETYRQIYDNHKEFYQNNSELYARVLRDALIEQIAIRMKYEKVFAKIEKYYRMPIVGRVLKKMFVH